MVREGPLAIYYEVVANLDKKIMESRTPVPAGMHVGVDEDEMVGLEVRRFPPEWTSSTNLFICRLPS